MQTSNTAQQENAFMTIISLQFWKKQKTSTIIISDKGMPLINSSVCTYTCIILMQKSFSEYSLFLCGVSYVFNVQSLDRSCMYAHTVECLKCDGLHVYKHTKIIFRECCWAPSPQCHIWNESHNLPSFLYPFDFFSQSLNSMFVPQFFNAKIVVTESESTIMLMLSFLVSCFCCIFCFGYLMMRYCFCRDTISRREEKK